MAAYRERGRDWKPLSGGRQKDFAREYLALNRVGAGVGGVNA